MLPSTASAPRSSRGSPGSSATTPRPTSPRRASTTRPRSAAACRRCSRSSPGLRRRGQGLSPAAQPALRACRDAAVQDEDLRPPARRARTGGRPLRAAVRAGPLRRDGLPPAGPRPARALPRRRRRRAHAARSSPTLAAAARAGGLEVVGESLRTAPRGYPRDHPRGELLRHKALVAGRSLPGAAGIGRDEALEHVAAAWRAAEPLNAWLDEHVGATHHGRRLG